MNNPIFPVSSNHPRRLRRLATAPVNPCAAAPSFRTVASTQNTSSEAQAVHSQNKTFSAHPESPSEGHLSTADREMLLRQQAISKAQQGCCEEAIALFTLLIHYNPHSASNYNNRGLLYLQNGQPEQALKDYNQALQLNPQLAKVYNNRANCYAALGELEAAIADYEMAIDLDPTDIRAQLNQGITFRELNLLDCAIERFDLALQFSQFINSTDTVSIPSALEGHIYAERGRAYHHLGDWNYAIADYHRALARLPLSESSSDVSARLRIQVKRWLDDLLNPLAEKQ